MQVKLHQTLYILILVTVLGAYSNAEDNPSIEGAYVLQSRVLANGSVLKPPEVEGIYTLTRDYVNFNIVQRNDEGKVFSVSMMAKNKLTNEEYYQELVYMVINDEIGGNGASYNFEKKSGASPVKITDGKIEFLHPVDKTIYLSFEGDKLTATRADGSYTANWVKVK